MVLFSIGSFFVAAGVVFVAQSRYEELGGRNEVLQKLFDNIRNTRSFIRVHYFEHLGLWIHFI